MIERFKPRRQAGQALADFALVVLLVAVVVTIAILVLGQGTARVFEAEVQVISGALAGSPTATAGPLAPPPCAACLAGQLSNTGEGTLVWRRPHSGGQEPVEFDLRLDPGLGDGPLYTLRLSNGAGATVALGVQVIEPHYLAYWADDAGHSYLREAGSGWLHFRYDPASGEVRIADGSVESLRSLGEVETIRLVASRSGGVAYFRQVVQGGALVEDFADTSDWVREAGTGALTATTADCSLFCD